MKNIFVLLIVSSLCLMCQRSVPTNSKLLKKSLCGVNLGNDYETYLNNIIQFQEKQPIHSKKRITFPVKIYFVSDSEQHSLSKIDVKNALNTLNLTFLSANIQFKWDELINSVQKNVMVDNIYENVDLEESLFNLAYDRNAINIYIFPTYQNIVGYTHYPIMHNNRVFISQAKLQDASLVHEFGHFFGLLHTFENTISAAESVKAGNCNTEGDKICDTPPDPSGVSFIEDTCKLYGEYYDNFGEAYTPDLANFMSYYGHCRTHFSPLQIERIYFIASRIKYPQMLQGV